ncbi:DUF4089 domain-containing protein [Paraburkholderia sp. 32]|uniref:DUF4089 domain-containing protein n=1 Tax=Paraburkholderia sp. 32 TaxID=2991057 RepID=UPI003D1F2817
MTSDEINSYVDSALRLQGYAVDATVTANVRREFARVCEIAAVFTEHVLPVEIESPAIFTP